MISSDGDDRMKPKVKTQKNPQGFQQNPKKSLDQKLTPKKSHADFVALKSSRERNQKFSEAKGISVTVKAAD